APRAPATATRSTSAGRVAPTATRSFTVTDLGLCSVTYVLILVRCSGASVTVAPAAGAAGAGAVWIVVWASAGPARAIMAIPARMARFIMGPPKGGNGVGVAAPRQTTRPGVGFGPQKKKENCPNEAPEPEW